MFHQSLSRRERWWLLALRIVYQYRARGASVASLVDRLLAQAGLRSCGTSWTALVAALEAAGADHLYIERFDRSGVTGDERDLLAALKACYLDDPIEAEHALSALLPPGRAAGVLEIMYRIAGRVGPRTLADRAPGFRPTVQARSAVH